MLTDGRKRYKWKRTIRVDNLVSDLFFYIIYTRVHVATASLSIEGLTPICTEPSGQRIPRVLNVISHAFSVVTTKRSQRRNGREIIQTDEPSESRYL